MRRKIKMIRIKAEWIKPYEEKVLTSGLCDFSLPVCFVSVNGERGAVYDSTGYTCLDNIDFKDTDNVLELVEKTMANLNKASEYLIDPVRIVLDGQTVFQNLKKRDVKFAYIPAENQRGMDNIMSILSYFELRCNRTDAAIIRTLATYIQGRNLSPEEIVKHVSFVRRELKKERRREGNRSA